MKLREIRERLALSQVDVAQRAHVSPATVTRLEAGHDAHPSTLRKLAEALGVTPAELQGLSS